MFKAIKENKIIAINNSGNFPCLIYDIVEEDVEHNTEDYEQYEGEYLLKEDIPAPTEEEQRENRARAYQQEVDPLHSRKQRKTILEEWTEDDEREYILKVKELSDKIAKEYPYPEGEDVEPNPVD